MAKKQTSEFDQKKEIMDLQSKHDLERHEYKMEELKYQRESDNMRHEKDMERQRIKSAEIRKTQMRRQDAFKY